ncbi:5816_t:CDS:1, partial [Gigaspora rosea]
LEINILSGEKLNNPLPANQHSFAKHAATNISDEYIHVTYGPSSNSASSK